MGQQWKDEYHGRALAAAASTPAGDGGGAPDGAARREVPLSAPELLLAWVYRQVPEPGRQWLLDTFREVQQGDLEHLPPAFTLAPRRVGQARMRLGHTDRALAHAARWGWRPSTWRVDEAARALLLLAIPSRSMAAYHALLEGLLRGGGAREHAALLRALPLLPHRAQFVGRAAEGVRADDERVFRAIALHNPYPVEAFSDPQWERTVLKAIRLGFRVDAIVGLELRPTPEVTHSLRDLLKVKQLGSRC